MKKRNGFARYVYWYWNLTRKRKRHVNRQARRAYDKLYPNTK